MFAAGFQCAFRFNSYIALALGARLYGDAGLAAIAVVIGVTVPIATVVAVAGFAGAQGTSIAREIAKNPLVVSLVAGVAWGAAGLPLPEVAQTVLSRLGAASLVLGLLAVGAALDPHPAAYAQGVRRVHPRGEARGAAGSRVGARPRARASPRDRHAGGRVRRDADGLGGVHHGGPAGRRRRVASTIISYGVAASLVTLPLWLAAVTGA